jgi:signal transduction histidine kinase
MAGRDSAGGAARGAAGGAQAGGASGVDGLAQRAATPTSGVAMAALLVAWAAVLARVLALSAADLWPWYIAGLVTFLVIHLVVLLRRPGPAMLGVAFAVQIAVTLLLLALDTQRDFLTSLFVLLCYQAAVSFRGRARLALVALLVAFIGVSLVLALGALHGLALALVPMAAGVVLATFVVVRERRDAALAASERLVAELRRAQSELHAYAGQVDELAAVEQRARLARELEASVSGSLAEARAAAAAAGALEDAGQVAAALERLQVLSQQALTQMRRILTELRPAPPEPRPRP